MVGFYLRFPKMVEVQNPRLVLLYFILQFGTVCFLTWWFITQQFWDKEVDIGSYINAGLSVSARNFVTRSFHNRVSELEQTVCASSQLHNYWDDGEGTNVFSDYSCNIPCLPPVGIVDEAPTDAAMQQQQQQQTENGSKTTSGPQQQQQQQQQQSGGACYVGQDAYITKGDDEVFIPTTRSAITRQQGKPPTSVNEFLLTPDAITVSLTYFFDIPRFSPDGNPMIEHTQGTSRKSLVTTLLNSDGSTRRVIYPGEPLTFNTSELLELAGYPDLLDSPHTAAYPNQRPGSDPVPPIARITGLELRMNIRCKGSIGYFEENGIKQCKLSIRKSERDWSFERVLDLVGSRSSSVEYTGIRIKVVGEGVATFFDFGTLVSRLTTCVVVVMLPRKLVMLMCLCLLGHLSTIYRQAIFEKFRIRDSLAGMAARLLVWNTAFVDLVDQESADGNFGISKKRIRERLAAVLKDRSKELDESEVNHLCEFAHAALLRLAKAMEDKDLKSQIDDVTNEINATKGQQYEEDSRIIDSDMFSVACTSEENLNFNSVVKLFDQERHRYFLERLFTPRELTLDIAKTQEIVQIEEAEQELSEESDMDVPVNVVNVEDGGTSSAGAESLTEVVAAAEAAAHGASAAKEGGTAEAGAEAKKAGKPVGKEATAVKALKTAATVGGQPTMGKSQESLGKKEKDAEGFTLEEERQLRKNLHKKVAQLLEEKQKLNDSYEEVKRTVQDHRHYFDTRHRDHLSKVSREAEVTQQLINEVHEAVRKRHTEMEEGLRARNEAVLNLQKEVTEKVDSLERLLKDNVGPHRADSHSLKAPLPSSIGNFLGAKAAGPLTKAAAPPVGANRGAPLAPMPSVLAAPKTAPAAPVPKSPALGASSPALPPAAQEAQAAAAPPTPQTAAEQPPPAPQELVPDAAAFSSPPPESGAGGEQPAASQSPSGEEAGPAPGSKEPWKNLFMGTLTSTQ